VLQFEFDHRGIGRGELKRCRHFGVSRRWRHRQHRELDLADVIIISAFVVVLGHHGKHPANHHIITTK
jgi:hypothetical protein